MRIGLIDVDGHNFPNIPLMKISAIGCDYCDYRDRSLNDEWEENE